MNYIPMAKSDWIEMDDTIIRLVRPRLKKILAKIDRRLRKRWKRYQF